MPVYLATYITIAIGDKRKKQPSRQRKGRPAVH